MTARTSSLVARFLAVLCFALCLWAVAPASAQNAAPPPATVGTPAPGGKPGQPPPPKAPGPQSGTAEHPAPESAGWGGDDVGLAIAFVVIILIAVFFYRRTSEPPRKPRR